MQARVRIETTEQAAGARAELDRLEQRFRAGADPASTRVVAREIIRLRTALTSYMLRGQVRELRDQKVR